VKGDPVKRQKKKFPKIAEMFFRVSMEEVQKINPDTGTAPVLRVTGYGTDGPANCWGNPYQQTGCKNPPERNSYNVTQQTATGKFKDYVYENKSLPLSDYLYIDITHLVDTQPGTSGAPVLLNSKEAAVGINSAGFRAKSGDKYSFGQSFRLGELRTALQNFQGGELATPIPGDRIYYVDRGGLAQSDVPVGNLFEPFREIEDAFPLATSQSAPTIVSVVAGIYGGTTDSSQPEPKDITVTPQSTLYFEMPVGDVVLWGTEE
jgi:hypothetical protein